MIGFQLPELSGSFSGVAYGIVGVAAWIVIIRARKSRRPNRLDSIPTVGSTCLLGCWWAGPVFPKNEAAIMQEGYEKYKPAPFKVADQFGWIVSMSDCKHIEELVRAPEDKLSFEQAARERMSSDFISEREPSGEPNIITVIRSHLTRNIGNMYPEIRDEIVMAFDEVLGLRDGEWKSVLALSAVQKVVCRTSNRVFVGLPLCRNPDWIDLNIQHTIDIVMTAYIVGLFPNILKPLAVFFFSRIGQNISQGLKLLGSIIEERRWRFNQCEDKADKPNDFLSWLMDEGPQMTVRALVRRILDVNFVAIHTSSISFTHALFYLATNPQYIQPLREEVKPIIEKEGWSKASIAKMYKVDSFLRECQRLEALSSQGIMRKALEDYTFSDGTFIPKGTIISVPVRALHHDDRSYVNAQVFEPFRFADMCQEDVEGAKHHLVSTAVDYLSFGHGKHACPGRFFAANELKTMLAHLVLTYDVKLADNTPHPASLRLGAADMPNPHAKVLFRKRVM